MKTIPFILTLNIKNKYLGINLTEEVKDPYTDKYKTQMEEIEQDTHKWKYILCSGIGRINIAECLHYPKSYTESM